MEPDAEDADIIPDISIVILEPSTLTPPITPCTPLPAIGKLIEGTIPIKLLNAKSVPFILYVLPEEIFTFPLTSNLCEGALLMPTFEPLHIIVSALSEYMYVELVAPACWFKYKFLSIDDNELRITRISEIWL